MGTPSSRASVGTKSVCCTTMALSCNNTEKVEQEFIKQKIATVSVQLVILLFTVTVALFWNMEGKGGGGWGVGGVVSSYLLEVLRRRLKCEQWFTWSSVEETVTSKCWQWRRSWGSVNLMFWGGNCEQWLTWGGGILESLGRLWVKVTHLRWSNFGKVKRGYKCKLWAVTCLCLRIWKG